MCHCLGAHHKWDARHDLFARLGIFCIIIIISISFSIRCIMILLLNHPQPELTQVDHYQDTGVVTGSKEDLTCLDKGSSSSASIQRPEKCQDEDHKNDVPRSSEKHDANEGAKAVPLGLGLGGLERKVKKFCYYIKLFIEVYIRFLFLIFLRFLIIHSQLLVSKIELGHMVFKCSSLSSSII